MTVTEPTSAGPAPTPEPGRRPGRRADLLAAAAAVGLVALAAGVGWYLLALDVPIRVDFPPLLARWVPHVGPGTVPAVLVAVAVVTAGPRVAATLRWGRLLLLAWLASLAWTVSLALVDGYERGFAGRLTTVFEYLQEVPRITAAGVPAFLDGFAGLISNDAPGHWTTHVAGHPPLATLLYVWLDQLGLGGGPIASTVTVLGATTAVVAIAVTLRALGAEHHARTFLPFGVLAPAAVWVGVSADGLFAAVLAWGVALTALAARRDGRADRWGTAALGLAAGLVLGASLYLNYGLSVAMLLPLAVLVLARSWRPAVPIALGAGAVTAAFLAAGFWWYDGYAQLLIRYVQPGEYGGLRPYSYFVWANVAALVVVVGLATVVGLRRLTAAAWDPDRRTTGVTVLAALAGAALLAVTLADLSGLSKAETERIWLPFAVWLLPAAALLPRPDARWWLAAQAGTALAVNHLLLTVW